MKVRLAIVALAFLALPALAASPQKPGKWQMKMEMDIPGMPFKMPPIVTTVCLSEEDVNNPEKSLPKDSKSDCKVGDYKIDGNKVTWTIDCPKQKTKGEGEITYTDDSYAGTMTMHVEDQEMKAKYSGKFLGACDKK